MKKLNIQAWIQAFRLRTLPLAASGILLGSAIAHSQDAYHYNILVMALVTTFLLQILSNLANDYGDHSHGTDNAKRLGPKRTVQSGAISPQVMKIAITVVGVLAFISGNYLLYLSFSDILSIKFVLFLITGIVGIAAAIKYTVGKSNYGYRGFGDLMVFIFFGLVSVWGSFYLHTHSLSWHVLIPSASIGLLSSGVLNVNNLRDHENDKNSGKHTVVVKLGYIRSKIYHSAIIGIAFILMFYYIWINGKISISYWLVLPGIIIGLHLFSIWKETKPKMHDPELKRLSLSTLLFALVSGIILML